MSYKYIPVSEPDKVYSTLTYHVIKGENRIALIQISFYLIYGKKEARIYVVRPSSLRYNPGFKKEIQEFANKLIEEYKVIEDEEGVRWWVKKHT